MATTPKLNLPLIEANMSADVPRDMNALANAVDSAVGDMPSVPTAAKNVAGAITELYAAKETSVGAQAKADAALASAKTYTDTKIAALPAPPVTSVAGKTGAVTLAKSDVGLGSVDNFGTATQAEAEAGTAANKFMTSQRTKQYVDKRLLNNLLFRVNGGNVEYSTDGSAWNPMGDRVLNMTPKIIQYMNKGLSVNAGSYVDVFSVTGSGVLYPFDVNITQYMSGGSYTQFGLCVVIDGVEHRLYSTIDGIYDAYQPTFAGYYQVGSSNSSPRNGIIQSNMQFKFNSSFAIRFRNLHPTDYATCQLSLLGGYYV